METKRLDPSSTVVAADGTSSVLEKATFQSQAGAETGSGVSHRTVQGQRPPSLVAPWQSGVSRSFCQGPRTEVSPLADRAVWADEEVTRAWSSGTFILRS